MKFSPILSLLLMRATIQANAATLRPSADTAEMCYGLDTKACEQVDKECDVNYTRGCQEYHAKLEQLADEEDIDDSYVKK